MKTTYLILLFCIAITGCGQANIPKSSLSQDRISQLEETIATAENSDAAPAAYAIAIVSSSGVDYVTSRGMYGSEEDPVNSEESLFYIASVTKSYVGLLAAVLDEDGTLPLDSRLVDYVDNIEQGKSIPQEITLRHLLSHTSGISNSVINFRLSNFGEIDEGEFARLLVEGSEWSEDRNISYNNLGYQVYAWVLEKETGKSWKAWLNEKIFRPLDLNHTRSSVPTKRKRIVNGRVPVSPEPMIVQGKSTETMHAAGGIYATAKDLGNFVSALLRKDELPRTVYESHVSVAAESEMSLLGASCFGYALGLMACDYGSFEIRGHLGQSTGWRSVMSFSDSLDIGVAIVAATDFEGEMWTVVLERELYNVMRGAPNTEEFGGRLAYVSRAYQQGIEQRDQERAASMRIPEQPPEVGHILGSYMSPDLGPIDLRQTGSGYEIEIGFFNAELTPVSGDSFLVNAHDGRLEEIRFADGKIHWAGDTFRLGPKK